jgi:energy-coupling factor transport system permease protein
VLNAQKSRGMKGTGFGALLPSMVPVFVGAIERVQQLSISLESRAFGSKGNKTSYRQVTMAAKDWAVLVVGLVASVASVAWVLLDKSLDWSRTMTFPPTFAVALVVAATIGSVVYSVLAIRAVLTA